MCNRSVFFFLSNLRLDYILSYRMQYLICASYPTSSLDLCLMLCMLPPLMSYSLALSSTMMSCTVHSPTDSLMQPACILVYIVCNPAPRGSPFELSLGLRSSQSSPIFPLSLRVSVWWFVLGLPWVASITKRLTIIRTKARGNIPGWKEIVTRDKGKHSYYKQKSRALHRVEESIAWQRNNKGTGRLQRSFYRGTGFCGVMGL